MCFSFEVSLLTGIFSWISGIYMLMNYSLPGTQYHDVMSLLIFSSMQFSDAILWKSEMKKDSINFLTTSYLIPFILTAQIAYNILIANKKTDIWGWAIVVAMAMYYFMSIRGYSKGVCENKLSSPIWGSKEIPIYILFLHYALIMYPNYTLFNILPLLIVPIIFKGAWGSMWCAFACIASVIYLVKFR